MSRMPKEPVKLVPVPSTNKIPERDIDKSPILECRHLGIDFGGLAAVKDFNMAIGRTEIAGLIGPNGAGKTTVFNLLTKVYQPTRGTILVDGVDTHNMNTVQVNKAGIARTFQNGAFIDVPLRDLVGAGHRDQLDRFLWHPTHCAAPPFFSCLPSRSRAKKPQTLGLLVASITRISTMAYTSIR